LRRYWRKETKKPERGDWRENRERRGEDKRLKEELIEIQKGEREEKHRAET
jgi:hypothetical protein